MKKYVDGCLLMLEAAITFETSVNVYQTTRRNNPEDSHLCTHRRENLKSHNSEELCWRKKHGRYTVCDILVPDIRCVIY
jgi:hypothetical protein